MATDKEQIIRKIQSLSAKIRDAAAQAGDDPLKIPAVEVDLMVQQSIELYDRLKTLKSLNRQQGNYTSGYETSVESQQVYEKENKDTARDEERSESSANQSEKALPASENQENPRETDTSQEEAEMTKQAGEQITSGDIDPASRENESTTGEEPHPEQTFKEASKERPSDEEEKQEKGKESENTRHSDKKAEETGEQSSLNDKFQDAEKRKNEIGEKYKNKPVSNLKSAISINQKMGFIRHLFKGDEQAYKKAISFLNKCGNYAEARFYIQDELKPQYSWDENDEMYQEFMQLVYRRFI